MSKNKFFILLFIHIVLSGSLYCKKGPAVLDYSLLKCYVDYFNRMEDENVVQTIPNEKAYEWLKNNVPLFACPQDNFQEIYYYRWWTFRKHLQQTPQGYVITEFLVPRSYADKYNLISCATGHHIFEGRWLHNSTYLYDYLKIWFRGNNGKPMTKLRKFSSWISYAVYNWYLVNGDINIIREFFDDLVNDYLEWEKIRRHSNGLFWQYDVQDGMEESISGGRKVKNYRPTINSYMYGNAIALYEMGKILGKDSISEIFKRKADTMKFLIQTKLWNIHHSFFETLTEGDTFANVREAIGYIPWYFNLPDSGYEKAWNEILNEEGFLSPFGLTTAERRHPLFRSHGCCKCEWDGAIWPFATSQTLTALINLLNNYKQNYVNDSVFFRHLELYVESQYYRGRPYIGEYLDEKTGYWLKGDQERSRYYNHSTFCDLIISGLVGLIPRNDNILEINPLIPLSKWDWFCLDNLLYHNNIITVIWDKSGKKFKKGKGFTILVNGKKIANLPELTKVTIKLKK